jgi:hypothetical protein
MSMHPVPQFGDCLPNGTIHLPISLTWHEVHSMCSNAHPPAIPILTYSSMQQCLWAKSPLEAAQFAEACTNHLALSSAEHLSYQERCHQAKSCPSVYMSPYH